MTKQLGASSQESYQIKVKGHLDSQWSEWFEGMTVTSKGGVTKLTGPVADQAALHRILNRIRNLGIPLISVNQIEPNKREESINL